VLCVVLQDSVCDPLAERGVKYVRMGGFRTCYTVVIVYHYLVDLVVTISSPVVAHYVVRTIGIDFPLGD